MEIRAVIDRFEEDKAVLLLGDGEAWVNWPKTLLPADAREGDVLSLVLDLDHEATAQAQAEVEKLMKELTEKKG